MKTTVEITDELFREVKAVAALRGTTLKSLFTKALERELALSESPIQTGYEVDGYGIPHLPSRQVRVTAHMIRTLQDEEDG